jgi:protein ImuB
MSGSTGRVACLLVPDLPLRAELRAHPDLEGVPFVVATGDDGRAELIAASAAARSRGVRSRGSLSQARAVCSELRVRVLSPALEQATRQALVDVALSFSPRAALAPRSNWAFPCEAAVQVDASGMTSLYASEAHFASALAARAGALGLPGFVAVASSQRVAHIAARRLASAAPSNDDSGRDGPGRDGPPGHDGPPEREGGICVLSPGSESRFLSPLPVDLLDPDDRLGQQLTRFGIHTVRDLLRLPRRALATRLGSEVLQLAAMARGEGNEPPLPAPADERMAEAMDLEYPADRIEPLLFVLRGSLSRLMERLVLRRMACGPLDLDLDLEGGGRDSRRVGVAAPTRDLRVLLRLLSVSLESDPPEAPVCALSLATRGQPLQTDQLDLFLPRGPDPNTLDHTLSELESLCGTDRVGAPEVADDHRPDAFGIKPFQPGAAEPSHAAARRNPGEPSFSKSPSGETLVVRALRPPVAAEVRVSRGLPTALRSAVSSGDVVHASGPWRTTGRWWSETERYALDHFDVQVSDGTVLRLCFDWHERSWRVDGVYD